MNPTRQCVKCKKQRYFCEFNNISMHKPRKICYDCVDRMIRQCDGCGERYWPMHRKYHEHCHL